MLIQFMVKMMNGFENTIKQLNHTINDLREEIRVLKSNAISQPTTTWLTNTQPLPARPNARVNPYPKLQPFSAPKPTPKNWKINEFKEATLIIHKTPGTVPFKGLTKVEIVQKVNKALSSVNAKVNGIPQRLHPQVRRCSHEHG